MYGNGDARDKNLEIRVEDVGMRFVDRIFEFVFYNSEFLQLRLGYSLLYEIVCLGLLAFQLDRHYLGEFSITYKPIKHGRAGGQMFEILF